MKIFVIADEWYPVYSLVKEEKFSDGVVNFTEEELERIEKAEKEFEACQDLIRDRME